MLGFEEPPIKSQEQNAVLRLFFLVLPVRTVSFKKKYDSFSVPFSYKEKGIRRHAAYTLQRTSTVNRPSSHRAAAVWPMRSASALTMASPSPVDCPVRILSAV